ncbi:TPA: hypothetical protein N0F65_009778 [Lagenidium giganteum]|uniref:Tc1-like transposase DDE domain-containing protein n=1 Tax=Lagenidium giganteum TaxID=4803 RepID=A0AAV2YU24_9STRA|nr:TPA: hypothetical protein N0F65_009778 [Lagenidium giganteum]
MNAEMFAKWFEQLCQVLQEDYGECRIHMDGAPYHKHILDKLSRTTHPVLVQANQVPQQVATYAIAEAHGHTVHLTPPYHPELQLIERVWGGQSKTSWHNDRWEVSTQTRMPSRKPFFARPASVWIRSYRAVQRQEQQYLDIAQVQLNQNPNSLRII